MTLPMTDEELDQIKADRNYWNSLIKGASWKLKGFTEKRTAEFHKGNAVINISQHTLDLLGITPDQ